MWKPSGKCYPYVKCYHYRRDGNVRYKGKTGLSTLAGLVD